MNWKNIKIFMLVLLVAVNIFLAAMVIKQSGMQVYDSNTLKNITELLSQSGISADRSFLTKKTQETSVYSCEIHMTYASNVANMIMGEYEDIFMTPQGFSFFGKNNEVLKTGKSFEIYYDIGINTLTLKNKLELDKSEKRALKETLSSLLLGKSLENSGYGIKLNEAGSADGFTYAIITQTVNDITVSNHTMKCILKDKQIVYLCGRWSFLPINENFSAHLLDSVNILFIEKSELDAQKLQNTDDEKIKDISLTVENMEQCYISHLSDDGTKLYFIPSWHIEWKENNADDTYYDAINGEKAYFENEFVN